MRFEMQDYLSQDGLGSLASRALLAVPACGERASCFSFSEFLVPTHSSLCIKPLAVFQPFCG